MSSISNFVSYNSTDNNFYYRQQEQWYHLFYQHYQQYLYLSHYQYCYHQGGNHDSGNNDNNNFNNDNDHIHDRLNLHFLGRRMISAEQNENRVWKAEQEKIIEDKQKYFLCMCTFLFFFLSFSFFIELVYLFLLFTFLLIFRVFPFSFFFINLVLPHTLPIFSCLIHSFTLIYLLPLFPPFVPPHFPLISSLLLTCLKIPPCYSCSWRAPCPHTVHVSA